ncbi:MAG: HTH domain-containing protein [Nanoarchaeota archaeon]
MNGEIIINELKNNKSGFTVSELAVRLHLSRHTVANTFAFLEGAGKISIRKAGMAKIYFWREKT